MRDKFKDCLDRRKIIAFSRGPQLVSKELKLSLEDLKSAKEIFKLKNYKWATVHSYYSMFHAARALLYSRKYREKSHYCLIEAIRKFYAEEGKLNFSFIEAIRKAKLLREEADYYGEYTRLAANDLIKKAEKFFNESKKITNEK